MQALGPSGWGFLAGTRPGLLGCWAAAVAAAVPPGAPVLGFQEGCPHPSSHFLFFPLSAFPGYFPFFFCCLSSQREKDEKTENIGKLSLTDLVVLRKGSCFLLFSLRHLSLFPALSHLFLPHFLHGCDPLVSIGHKGCLAALAPPLPPSSWLFRCSELPLASGSPLLKLTCESFGSGRSQFCHQLGLSQISLAWV